MSGAAKAGGRGGAPASQTVATAYGCAVANTSKTVSGTTRAKSGRLSGKFWKLLGASTEKNQSRSMAEVNAAADYAKKAAGLDDEQLRKAAQLLNLKDLADASDIPQFLAIAREAAERSIGLRPFDVQLQGALRMLAGDVVEMATGEGKTLSGAIAAAGYAIGGRHVHVVTINDYLARRDAEWMGPLLTAMGVTVGWITADSSPAERRAAYQCDVTYASVNEIGFDVLRDQLVTDVEDLVSPNPDVALIDEADSVLVDEALVPLVLAGTTHRETPRMEIVELVGRLTPGVDYDSDEDRRNIHLTEKGARRVEAALGGIDLYSEEHVVSTLTEVNVALHAHVLLQRDVHYIVRDGKVQLINASRGRIAALQRWPDGLQAAVEAKEGIETTETGEVLDTITVQALVNRYPTVCGMTGTALAAGEQLRQFYQLGVSPIPPNMPNIREDEADRVYITAAAKNDAIVAHIVEVHETGQPVLVGTHDVAESEELYERLRKRGVPAVVLNAKNDAEEATVIAEAGKLGAVTVSTQMAGRGTDIRLGGSDEAHHDKIVELGGLHVIGTARQHTQRLDNQLRGRAGRQGDPGSSVFFSSWEDEVAATNLEAGKMPTETDEDGRIVSPKASGMLDHAQRIAEGKLLDIHANTWRYNQLIAQQRAIIVERRNTLLSTPTAREELAELAPQRYAELREKFGDDADAKLEKICRLIMLYHLDRGWADHLAFLADIRESIHLRALGRQNPLDEFHRMALDAFASLAADAIEAAQQTFETSEQIESEPGIDLSKLARPTSTWTYMVRDNPLSDDTMDALSLPGIFR
ncbi:accessory Sec system translocase SecA2 [Mycolicibacter kumamotonensis]|jgi:preprotein translocase subunit SecA|uniref:Protein translocase subunit SecA n=1 Tax=Mycolicibacter kumamotonensis TaxID=354243 RepID=A0A1X0E4P7_9MYCO|nr:accessory Sec system translocase SecA2 [Mycolicibacter kumamotonensis]ORA79545.1 accessory Sec system translocase SecA2 [Mycolicibacter kumamotonensis]